MDVYRYYTSFRMFSTREGHLQTSPTQCSWVTCQFLFRAVQCLDSVKWLYGQPEQWVLPMGDIQTEGRRPDCIPAQHIHCRTARRSSVISSHVGLIMQSSCNTLSSSHSAPTLLTTTTTTTIQQYGRNGNTAAAK